MKNLLILLIFSCLNLTAQLIPYETLKETAERTGYSVKELREWFPPLKFEYDLEGLDTSILKSPPKPYIHPRVFFNPEDVPLLRQRYKDTETGKATLKELKVRIARYLGAPEKRKESYLKLVRGDADANTNNLRVLAEEAFRCLIEDDQNAGKMVADALANAARLNLPKIEALNPTNNFQYGTQKYIGRDGLARGYDLAYNWMTKEQQSICRKTLAAATNGKWVEGMGHLPAWEACFENRLSWIGGEFIVNLLAIEGEEGFDKKAFDQMAQGLKQLMALGFFKSGASYEGMSKNSPFMRHFIPLAKRGLMHIAQVNGRRFIDKFRLHTMQPWGHYWINDGNWGGNLTRGHLDDFAAMKWAFPNDNKVDFMFRNALNPETRAIEGWHAEVYPSGVKSKKSWYDQMKEVTKDEPLTFFCEDRGLVVSRSEWEPDALHFYFQPRSIVGGHRHGSRNMLLLSSHGRVWFDYTRQAGGSAVGNVLESRYHNVTLVDGEGQAWEAPPGRMVSFNDSDKTTIASGDASFAYSVRKCKPGENHIELTVNDFRLNKSDIPWMNIPWKYLPDWFSSEKLPVYGTERKGVFFGCSHERKWEANWAWKDIKFKKAFRTAGIIRGKNPYVILTEDIQKDDKERLYEMLFQLPNDVEMESAVTYFQKTAGVEKLSGSAKVKANSYLNPGKLKVEDEPIVTSDIILKETSVEGSKGNRRLLIRVLQCEGDITDKGRPASLQTYVKYARTHKLGKRLVIPSRSVEPKYKLFIYPFVNGQKLPKTVWNRNMDELKVEFSNQTDKIQFKVNEEGRTDFSVVDVK